MSQAPTNDKIYSVRSQLGDHEAFGWATTETYNRLWWLIHEYDVRSVIEVGSFVGMTAVWLSDMTQVELVYCVDTFDKPNHHREPIGRYLRHPGGEYWKDSQYKEFLRNTLPYVNVHHLKMPSLEAAELDVSADLVYIDADHSYEAVKADIEAWRPHARKVICGDDNNRSKYGVARAVEELGIPNRDERIWWDAIL